VAVEPNFKMKGNWMRWLKCAIIEAEMDIGIRREEWRIFLGGKENVEDTSWKEWLNVNAIWDRSKACDVLSQFDSVSECCWCYVMWKYSFATPQHQIVLVTPTFILHNFAATNIIASFCTQFIMLCSFSVITR